MKSLSGKLGVIFLFIGLTIFGYAEAWGAHQLLCNDVPDAYSSIEKCGAIIQIDIKFELIANGKPTGSKGTAALEIWSIGTKPFAEWNEVLMHPMHSSKQIALTGRSYKTDDGSISDVEVYKDHFSLTLRSNSETFKIVGVRKSKDWGYGCKCDISGVGFIFHIILKELIKNEIRSIDKIVLPYTEVYP